MVSLYPQDRGAQAIWLDLRDPDSTELAKVEKLAGVAVPSRESLSEIESSSRLKARDGALSMSVPMVTHIEAACRRSRRSGSCCRASI